MTAIEQSLERTANLQKWLLFLLLGAMFVLMIEVRFEHQAVLGEKWQAWIPIAYCGFMCLAIPISIGVRSRFGLKPLIVSFILLGIVGLMGTWFHAGEKPATRISSIIATDLGKPGELIATDDDSAAPLLAPLALVGLGAMGVLISLLPFKIEQRTQ